MFLPAFNTIFNTMIKGKLFQKGYSYSGAGRSLDLKRQTPKDPGSFLGPLFKDFVLYGFRREDTALLFL